jgi:hypothetical protein
MTEPIKTKISGTITSASIFKKKVNEALTYQILEMVDRAKLAKEFNGLVARIEGKTHYYISLGKFASIVFTGDLQSQLENAKHAVNAMLKKVADESLESSVQTAEFSSSLLEAKLRRTQSQAKYLIKIRSESEKLEIATPSHSTRRLLTMKGCEIILSMLDAEAKNSVGYWRVMKFFQVAHLIGTDYDMGEDCLVGLTIENLGMGDKNTKRDTHVKLILGEKLSYSKDDPAYILRSFKDKSEHQYHTTYITDIGIAELIFRNRCVDSCEKICEVLDRIDANIKNLGGRGLERWGCKTSLGKKMRYIVKRNDFIHMCDRLKWEEQYRLPACDWEIREDGLAGFRAATIAWHEAQDALKRNSDAGSHGKQEAESLAAVAPVNEPFDFKFEGSNEGLAQSHGKISENPMSSLAPTSVVDTTIQPPALQPAEKTIHQKLQEIADRANAKKRDIDEAMNLEMVALFSSEQATARNARKLGMPESSPTPGAMVCGFS